MRGTSPDEALVDRIAVLRRDAARRRTDVKVADRLERQGDEIMVCGQLYHTTTRVVLWTDPGGYDAYRVEPRFAPSEPSHADRQQEKSARTAAVRFGMRQKGLTPEEIEKVRGGGWDLPLCSGSSTSSSSTSMLPAPASAAFEVLQDRRGLSVHFMLDLDGTIYQTLDLKEAAWHATIANGRSIGIEVANIGAYPVDGPDPLAPRIDLTQRGRSSSRAPSRRAQGTAAILRPSRNEPVVGTIQGKL